jgi:hypothetical protein
MSIQIYNTPLEDEVLNAKYFVGHTDYKSSINELFPLIQRLDIQRNLQKTSFYARLREDLKRGCIIPAITIAFIVQDMNISNTAEFINENINKSFILDGIQRLNAIKQAYDDLSDDQKRVYDQRTLHLNILIAPSMDKLLYRMITLNNGQKPMSPRHQIDILSETILDFDNLEIRNQTHKEKQGKSDRLAVHRSDIVKGYIAYLSDTTAIDNKLIIEEKMDELIADKIIDSDIPSDKYEFLDILRRIANFSQDDYISKWFVASNNFIGFCVACRKSFDLITELESQELAEAIKKFEKIFSNFDKKKIKVGDYRRKMVSEFFGNIRNYLPMSDTDVILDLSTK